MRGLEQSILATIVSKTKKKKKGEGKVDQVAFTNHSSGCHP